MADGAVSFLLQQLSAVLRDEVHMLGGLKQEVQSIQRGLGSLKAFLIYADAKAHTDDGLKDWLCEVREISFEFQDVLDIYMLRFGRRRGWSGLRGFFYKVGSSVKNLKARHQIASEINSLNLRLVNAINSQQINRDLYSAMPMGHGSSSTVAETERYDGRGDALFLEDDEVVGIEKPKKMLLEWIERLDSGLDVIAVVGMGGLGKTTLVKKVYDDESVKNHFNRHVWIVVSDYKDVKHLLENLIKKLVGEIKESPPQGLTDMSLDEMRSFIHKFLKEKTYIIVLDDVWKPHTWEAVKLALPRKGAHGCVIITSRDNNIGDDACHVHELNPLPEEESERLFFRKAFPVSPCPDFLKEYADKILQRCEGLPLALIVIGGLLAKKNNTADELNRLHRRLTHNNLNNSSLDRLWRLFSVSYNDLPYYLKYCLSYLSIFPEGSLLEKEKILRLWTAEGFVQSENNQTLEDVAGEYLNELCSRNLIQVAEKHADGRVRAFRIHDLLREYITSISREHSIVTVYKGKEEAGSNIIRRLVIQNSANLSFEANNVSHLRSLLLFDGDMEMRLIKEFVTRCKLLKVLDLRGASIESIPNEVFKLYHLKYLCFRDTKIKLIPKSIKYLANLETLDLKRTNVIELPKEILKLRRLRHLSVYKYKVEDWYKLEFGYMQSFTAPYNVGSMQSLQKLSLVDADEVLVKEIGKLTQLRRLGIAKMRRVYGNDLCTSISKLTNLRSLTIGSIGENEELHLDYPLSFEKGLPFLRALFLNGHMERVPQWISSLHGLSTLHLRWIKMSSDPLSSIQDLPSLTYLVIHGAQVEELVFNARGFKKLKVIRLYEFKLMKWMKIEEGSMPSLQEWEVCDCELLTEIPQGIEHLSLKYLGFHDMPDQFVNMIVEGRRSQGSSWRLAHVPYIYFSTMRNGLREYSSLLDM